MYGNWHHSCSSFSPLSKLWLQIWKSASWFTVWSIRHYCDQICSLLLTLRRYFLWVLQILCNFRSTFNEKREDPPLIDVCETPTGSAAEWSQQLTSPYLYWSSVHRTNMKKNKMLRMTESCSTAAIIQLRLLLHKTDQYIEQVTCILFYHQYWSLKGPKQ